ncbi:hypothetical protein KJ359_002362 [Pestalotiopsis sp. 9143b]|nr:hypothetical protein KJ359_002362 [Pestalotiopsis sp. 9143b]
MIPRVAQRGPLASIKPWKAGQRAIRQFPGRIQTPLRSVIASDRGLNFAIKGATDGLKRTSLPNIWLRVESKEGGVKVRWSDNFHESFYPWDFIDYYLQEDKPTLEDVTINTFTNKGNALADKWPPSVSSKDIEQDETKAIGRLTNYIRKFGFGFITEVPYDTAEPSEELLEKIAFIRQTHYGGFYDFVPDLALADTAYTNIALAAHTDNTYFSDPAGLQAFHLLSHVDKAAESGKESLGGQSLLVDGFWAAALLKDEDPKAWNVLSRVRLPWHASGNEGITIAPDKLYPVLEVDEITGELQRVRWNNDDRGVVPFHNEYSPEEWYDAARKWEAILKRESVEYWFQLKPGNLLVFDNWRVLHGRSAFTGIRRICGAYINRDDFISRWRNTNFPREEIMRRVVG